MSNEKFKEKEFYLKWKPLSHDERIKNGYPKTRAQLAEYLKVNIMTLTYWDKKLKVKPKSIQVEGVIKEITTLTTEQQKQWWVDRMPVLNDVLFKIATDKDIPKATQVKALELIKKEVGAITEKREITIVNPEDVARRGIEAAKELKEFECRLLPAPIIEEARIEEREDSLSRVG